MNVSTRRMRWSFYDSIAATRGDFWTLMDKTGIVVFVGPNGSGKSLAMVNATLRTLDGEMWDCDVISHRHHAKYQQHAEECNLGCSMMLSPDAVAQRCPVGVTFVESHRRGYRLVYSTAELLDEAGRPHERYRKLETYQQLVTIEHADVLFDEVAGIMDSGDSDKVPVQVRNYIHKLRHFDNRLRVTTPAYMRCAKSIRQVAQVVVDSRAFFPEKAHDGRLWRPLCGMVYRAFDAFEFEDYTSSTKDNQKIEAKTYFWRPGSRASRTYHTLGAVTQLGHVDEAGLCMGCGGSRSAPRCTCPPDMHVDPDDKFDVITQLSGSTRTKRVVLRSESPTTDAPTAVLSTQ